MYKRVFKYEDFDGNKREEEHYFNLTKAEVTMWLTTSTGYTLDQLLEELTQKNDAKRIMEIFEDLILRSYGVKSPDGRKFVKSKELSDDFKSTEAYSDLFMEVVTDGAKAATFINAILPKDLSKDVTAALKENEEALPKELQTFLNEQPVAGPVPLSPFSSLV